MRSNGTQAVVLLLVVMPAIHFSARTARADPITVGVVAVTLGTGIVVGIAVSEFNANYLNIAHGYATPLPDSHLVWTLGRGNSASAFDSDPATLGVPGSFGTACAGAGYIYDTVNAKQDCLGIKAANDYFNAARIYKNGVMNENATAGTPAPGVTRDLKVDLQGLPARQDVKFDMHTGKISSLDALMGGGARSVNGTWVPWRSFEETEPVVRNYLSGALTPDPGSTMPTFAVPSVDDLFAADDASGAVDWFPFFLAAVSSTGTFEQNGETFYNPFSFNVPLPQDVPLDGIWYSSVEVLQANAVPEPATMLLLGTGVAIFAASRVRKTSWRI